MTRAHTIMTALLTRALDAGEVELRGAQLYQWPTRSRRRRPRRRASAPLWRAARGKKYRIP